MRRQRGRKEIHRKTAGGSFSPRAAAEIGFGKPPRDRTPRQTLVGDVRAFAGAGPTERSSLLASVSGPAAGAKMRVAPECAARGGRPLPVKKGSAGFPTPASRRCPSGGRGTDPTTARSSGYDGARRSRRRSQRCDRNHRAAPGSNRTPAGRVAGRRWIYRVRCPRENCGGSARRSVRNGDKPVP